MLRNKYVTSSLSLAYIMTSHIENKRLRANEGEGRVYSASSIAREGSKSEEEPSKHYRSCNYRVPVNTYCFFARMNANSKSTNLD